MKTTIVRTLLALTIIAFASEMCIMAVSCSSKSDVKDSTVVTVDTTKVVDSTTVKVDSLK